MGAAKFTSGPWSRSESGREPIIDADGQGIISACGCCDGISARSEDLALLAAAPDLYAALATMLEAFQVTTPKNKAEAVANINARRIARAAIAKAEGNAAKPSRVQPGEPDPRD